MLRAPLRNSLLPIKYSDSVMAIGLFQLVGSDLMLYCLKNQVNVMNLVSILALKDSLII